MAVWMVSLQRCSLTATRRENAALPTQAMAVSRSLSILLALILGRDVKSGCITSLAEIFSIERKRPIASDYIRMSDGGKRSRIRRN
jgi:hypothetical protein